MSNAVVGNVYRVTFHNYQRDQAGLNVKYWKVIAIAGTGAAESTVALILGGVYAAAIKPCMSQQAEYQGISLQRVLPALGLDVIDLTGAGPGSSGIDSAPLAVAGLLSFSTLTPGRTGRGRMYVPFPSQDDMDTDSSPTVAYQGVLTTLGATFLGPRTVGGGGNTSTGQWGLLHKETGVFSPMNDVEPEEKWGTQHRRGDFGRQNPSFP